MSRRGAPQLTAGTRCSCGKVRYLTRSDARRAAARIRKRFGRLDTYPCGDFWHLGHLPRDVIAGERGRDDITHPGAA